MPRVTSTPLAGNGFKGVSRARGFASTPSKTITVAGPQVTNGVGTTSIILGSGNQLRAGEKLDTNSAVVGNNVNVYTVRLAKNAGSATGTASMTIRNSGDVSQITLGTIDVSTLTGSFTDYNFTAGSAYKIAAGDRALIEYSGGDTNNNIITAYDPSTVIDSNNTYMSQYNGTYTNYSGQNTRFTLTTTTSGLGGGGTGIVIG